MSDWIHLNKCRIPPSVDKVFGSTPEDGFNGAFHLQINKLPVLVIASDGGGWQHVSVSISGSGIPPSWSVMSQVKDLFWDDEVAVMQLHPPKSKWVNIHPGCLHLWRPTKSKIPLPNHLMVGPKTQEDVDKINADPTSPVKIL